MRLAVRTNGAEVLRQLDQFVQQLEAVALPRALNRLREQAQVAGLRRIGEIYKIGPRTMETFITNDLATAGELKASLSARGKGFPMSLFDPRPSKPSKGRPKGAGVSVLIKGRRVFIPHAFIARTRSGHIGVFARGAYGGKGLTGAHPTGEAFGRFQFARGRSRKGLPRGSRALPINELYSSSPPDALSNPDVTEAMNARLEEQASKVIASEIRFAASR